jgi:hypothetical protein
MLVGQTHALHNMFMLMLGKMGSTNNVDHLEAYARIALKAQNQSRATVSTLNDLKNPQRATFIKQLNQANQMQVNNSENFLNTENELLDVQNGERLDSGATCKTSSIDQTWQPWKKSTGAKTTAGKEKSKMNAMKHGRSRATMRELGKLFAEGNRLLREIQKQMDS